MFDQLVGAAYVWTMTFVGVSVVVQGQKCCRDVCVCVCVCMSISGWGGGPEGGPAAFTRSASCRVERVEEDNNSWVKIQLFAWGLTLWGLSGRSVGGEGFRLLKQKPQSKPFLSLTAKIVKMRKLPQVGERYRSGA